MWRFNSEARSDLKGLDSETTLGEYLKSNGYPEEFIQHFICLLYTSDAADE